MSLTAADFKDLLYRLMPKGPVWPVDADTTPVWDSLLDALSQEPARVQVAADQIPLDLIPTSDMGSGQLEAWETVLDLHPQTGDSNTTRITAIRTLLLRNVSPTLAQLTTYAAALKPSAVVQHHLYAVFTMGINAMGDPLNGDQWLASWKITYSPPVDTAFQAAMLAVTPINTTLIFAVT